MRFVLHAAAMTAPVLSVAVAYYLLADPFKVLWQYDDYFPDPQRHPPGLIGVKANSVVFLLFMICYD